MSGLAMRKRLSPRVSSGLKMMKQGLLREAAEDFEAARKENPNDLEALQGLCRVHLAKGELAKARPLLQELQRRAPGDVESHSALLRLDADEGDDLALAKLRALASREDAGFFELLQFGRALLHRGRHAQAVRAMVRAVNHDPKNAHAFFLLGQAYLGLEDLPRARKALIHAHELSPRELAPLELAARVLELQGQIGKAIVVLHRAVTTVAPEDARVWGELARLFLLAKNPAKAARAAFEVRTLKPKSGEGAHLQGLALLLQGKAREAAALFEEAIRLSPQAPEPMVALSKARSFLHMHAAAIAVLEQAVEQFPARVEPALELSVAYLRQPKKPKAARAIELLERALKANPDHAGLNFNLALAYADSDKAKAKACAEKAKADPKLKAEATRLIAALGK